MKTIEQIAKEIVEVQPMPSNIFKDLVSAAKSEKELVDGGYEPVSHHRLFWIKKD